MPRTFRNFTNRTRSVSIFPDTPDDDVRVTYRVESLNDDFRQDNQQNEQAQRQRQRAIDALDRKIAAATDDAEREHLADERERLQTEHNDRSVQENAKFLLRLLVSWDLFEDEALTQPTPINFQTLAALGGQTLAKIVERCIADMSGTTPQNGSPSVNGSEPGASAVNAPAGTSLSR